MNPQLKDYLSIFLKRVPAEDIPILANFQFTLLNVHQHIIHQSSLSLLTEFYCNNTARWGIEKLVKLDVLRKPEGLPLDQLHFHCKLVYEYSRNSVTDCLHNCVPSQQPSNSSQNEVNFRQLYERMPFSDLVVNVQGQSFDAHKVVLATKSPVFFAMFQNDHVENNTLDIVDIEPTVFDLLLRFLYTDELDSDALNLWSKDLFVVADKYLLEFLKSKCELALSHQVNVRNCCDLLVLGEDHSAQLLKRNTMDFLRSQAPLVLQTQGWTDMKLSHPQLCLQVFEKLNNVTFKYALPG